MRFNLKLLLIFIIYISTNALLSDEKDISLKSFYSLFKAIDSKDIEKAKKALESGINLNVYKDGLMPLHKAMLSQYEDMVYLLLENGADIYSNDKYDKESALSRSIYCKYNIYASSFKNYNYLILKLDKFREIADIVNNNNFGKLIGKFKDYLKISKLSYQELLKKKMLSLSKKLLSSLDKDGYTKIVLGFLSKQKYLNKLPRELRMLVDFNKEVNSLWKLDLNSFYLIKDDLQSIYSDSNDNINYVLNFFDLKNYKNNDLLRVLEVYNLVKNKKQSINSALNIIKKY